MLEARSFASEYSTVASEVLELNGWAVFLDVYGFSALADTEGAKEIAQKLLYCHQLLEQKLGWSAFDPLRFKFQDSMILFYGTRSGEDRLTELHRCIGDVEEILAIFAGQGLPLRGGIAHGTAVYNGVFLFGDAPIRAYRTEQTLPAPIVFLPAKECLESLDQMHQPLPVAIPRLTRVDLRDDGMLAGMVLVPTPIDDYMRVARENAEHYSITGPAGVALAWQKAYEFIAHQLERERQE